MTLLKRAVAHRAPGSSFSPERSKTRSLLRKAAQGNVHSFVQAAASYTNFISEYLYLSGITGSTQRHFEVQRVLSDCWRYLPYTRRVSDFERFLQVRLERHAEYCSLELPEPHNHLSDLDHTERFLLAARVLEGWSTKSLKLALRCTKRELSHSLMKLKCKLTGFRTHMLRGSELYQVLRVSELLEGEFANKAARKVEQELSGHFHAHQFKADWLSYRCELADLRLEMALSEADAQELNERVTKLIKQQPMEKPRLADSLINQITFIRLPSR